MHTGRGVLAKRVAIQRHAAASGARTQDESGTTQSVLATPPIRGTMRWWVY